jgi:hypothetical protein
VSLFPYIFVSIPFKMAYASFFLNRTADKSRFDLVRITKTESDSFKLQYYDDQTKVNLSSPHRSLILENHEQMLEYVDCMLSLLKKDMDREGFVSVDFGTPIFPIVCSFVQDVDTVLIKRCLHLMK